MGRQSESNSAGGYEMSNYNNNNNNNYNNNNNNTGDYNAQYIAPQNAAPQPYYHQGQQFYGQPQSQQQQQPMPGMYAAPPQQQMVPLYVNPNGSPGAPQRAIGTASTIDCGPVFMRRPATSAYRLIIDFEPIECCSPGVGVPDYVIATVPPQLMAYGVTQQEWTYWMSLERTSVQPQHLGCGVCTLVAASITWCFVFPLVCACSRMNKYQDAVRDWLDGFNRAVLEPRGLYAKTQIAQMSDGNNKHNKEISWLAIALTPGEAAVLRAEPHVWRYQPGCPACSCCGCPEEDIITPMSAGCQQTFGCCGTQRRV